MACKKNKEINKEYCQDQLKQLQKGDRVQFKRGIYSHWGIYYGDEKIIHLAGENNDGINANPMNSISIQRSKKATVRIDDFWKVAGSDKAKKNNKKDSKYSPYDPDVIIQRAESKMNQEIIYDVFKYNCEHFANWCRYGKEESDQVDKYCPTM